MIAALLLAFQLVTVSLPDSPVAKQDPCAGVKAGDVCAATGKRYYPDMWGFDRHNKSFSEAAKQPFMLIATGLMVGTSIFDVRETQVAESRHPHGSEANPLYGKSAAQQWGVAIGGDALLWILAVEQKKRGHGVLSFMELCLVASGHFFAAEHNRAL